MTLNQQVPTTGLCVLGKYRVFLVQKSAKRQGFPDFWRIFRMSGVYIGCMRSAEGSAHLVAAIFQGEGGGAQHRKDPSSLRCEKRGCLTKK
jgi:hypothetical protein